MNQRKFKKLEKKIYESILHTVAQLELNEKCYSLVLAYGEEYPLPPILGLGLVSERDLWKKENSEEAKYFIWNPAEYLNYDTEELEISTNEVVQLCDEFYKDVNEQDQFILANNMLKNIALQLNKLNWKKYLSTTTDFIVFWVDFEGANLEENLNLILSKRQIVQFKNKNFL